MKTQNIQTSILVLTIGLLWTSMPNGRAELVGSIQASQIMFEAGKPIVADGTGTIKNESGEVVASGNLVINEGTLELHGTKGASFAYPSSSATACPTNWPTQIPTNVASLEFDGKDKWTLKDDQFLFILEMGGNFQAKILVDESLLLSSRISFPEGKYSLWGYSITAGADGGAVVFKQGRPVGGDNASVETPEKKKLEFPHKAQ